MARDRETEIYSSALISLQTPTLTTLKVLKPETDETEKLYLPFVSDGLYLLRDHIQPLLTLQFLVILGQISPYFWEAFCHFLSKRQPIQMF